MTKSSGRSATSDYSCLTDSQCLFGSQFWSDQSSQSQEMSLQSKNSQQNSQEVNESKVSTNYHTKPFLFGGESKDKSKMPNLSCSKGILEQFEEEKKKAREKTESEMLMSELSQLKECMENMKNSFSSMNGNADCTKTAVMEALGGFTKTLQGAVASMQEGFAVQFGTVLNKLDGQLEALRDMGDRESKIVSEVATLATCMHSLQRELESLRAEQAKEQCMMGEVLFLLRALASSRPPATPVADSGVQTSPCPWERLCLVSERTRCFQSLQLSAAPAPQPQGEMGYLGPLQPIDQEDPSATGEPNLQAAARTEKAHHTRSPTARTPGVRGAAAGTWTQETACSQPGGVLTEAHGGVRRSAGLRKQAGRQKRAVQRGHRTRAPKRRRKALPLCGGQGAGNGGRATSPDPASGQSPARPTAARFNPCAGWSQDSSGTQFVSECETTTASWVMPVSEAKTEVSQKGFWQLFDFCDDSD